MSSRGPACHALRVLQMHNRLSAAALVLGGLALPSSTARDGGATVLSVSILGGFRAWSIGEVRVDGAAARGRSARPIVPARRRISGGLPGR